MTIGPGIEYLVAALRDRNYSTLQHSERAARYACLIGQALGLKNGQLLALNKGGLLHDLGKLSVPQVILDKPAPLTSDEWSVIRLHPIEGHKRLIGRIEDPALDVVLFHHEWFDGRGYPGHVKGESIPILARVFSIADAFDAMTSDRPCRQAMSAAAAREEIMVGRGIQFDPVLVEVFNDTFDVIVQEREDSGSRSAPLAMPVLTGMAVPVRRR